MKKGEGNKYANLRFSDGDRADIDAMCRALNAKATSRPLRHQAQFAKAMKHVNKVAGGEPRGLRRLMARARAHNIAKGKV